MEPLELNLADGWKLVPPKRSGFGLARLFRGGLRCEETDFAHALEFEVPPLLKPVSELNCPIAVDDIDGRVYWGRVLPTDKPGSRGLGPCVLMESTLRSRASRVVMQFPDGMSPNWLLSLGEDRSCVFAQIHGDPKKAMPLARIDVASGKMNLIEMEQETFFPLEAYPSRGLILFRMRDGRVSIYDLDGRRIALCANETCNPHASLHPSQNLIAVSDKGIFLWDWQSQKIEKLLNSGEEARWSPDGKQIWYSEGDSALWMLDVGSRKTTKIVQLSGDTAKSDEYGQPVFWNPSQRYLVARMSRKAATSPEEEKKRRESFPKGTSESSFKFDYDHYFCILDLEEKLAWTHPGYCHKISWFTVHDALSEAGRPHEGTGMEAAHEKSND